MTKAHHSTCHLTERHYFYTRSSLWWSGCLVSTFGFPSIGGWSSTMAVWRVNPPSSPLGFWCTNQCFSGNKEQPWSGGACSWSTTNGPFPSSFRAAPKARSGWAERTPSYTSRFRNRGRQKGQSCCSRPLQWFIAANWPSHSSFQGYLLLSRWPTEERCSVIVPPYSPGSSSDYHSTALSFSENLRPWAATLPSFWKTSSALSWDQVAWVPQLAPWSAEGSFSCTLICFGSCPGLTCRSPSATASVWIV